MADDKIPLKSEIVLTSEVKWDQLNPARGAQSPRAGTLWGDRNGRGPTGFLFNPVDGFQSPPHVHNVSYRGIVIRGLVHNDDPKAENMWMPKSSFWTQPKGQDHITSAQGQDTLAYIEIEEGPYLVHPSEEKFDTQEVPVNIDASNLVWVDAPSGQGTKLAYLWGSPREGQLNGTLLKLPVGSSTVIRSRDSNFRAVVIQGQPRYRRPDTGEVVSLEPGSLFMANGAADHELSSSQGSDVVVYLRSKGNFELGSGS